MTVVVETRGPFTYVARYDRSDERGVHLLDVGVHEESSGIAREEYIARSARFGVKVEQRHLILAADQVARISQLANWEPVQSGR